MHTWAKRGLQTALVTGGLFILGTGIASAQDAVHPDAKPTGIDAMANASPQAGTAPSPLVDAPIQAKRNTVNTPLGNEDLPDDGGRLQVLNGTPDLVNGLTRSLIGTDTVTAVGVPVQAVNNQVGVGEPANASGDASQGYSEATPVTSDGTGQTLQGNVIRSQNIVPVQAADNAVAVGNDASTSGTVAQCATGGGDINTSGKNGTIAGTVADQRSAIPVGAGGNAIAVAGTSNSSSCTSQDVTNNGKDTTDGTNGTLAGTVANVPAALPVIANTNVASVLGRATGAHTSGDQVTGANGSTASAVVTGDSFNKAPSSVLSGTTVSSPVAAPTGAYGTGLTGGGSANARHSGIATVLAGGSTYGDGSNSTGSGTTVAAPVATVVELVCTAGSLAGNATAGCAETRTVTAGFYNGSLGDDGTLAGNVVQAPQVAPVEALSNAVAAGGHATSNLTETKQINAGWTPNSNDDNGTLSSNVVQAANALAVEANTVGVGALGTAEPNSAVTVIGHAGQPAKASGRNATGSGNVVNESAAYYAVVEETLATVGGKAHSVAANSYNLVAQGPVSTTGKGGTVAGNIVPVSLAGGVRHGGVSAPVLGSAGGVLNSVSSTAAGGTNTTNGDQGVLSGNILPDVPLALPVDAVGHAYGVGGRSRQDANVLSPLSSGGDGTASGQQGTLSGNIASIPLAPVVTWFGSVVNVASRTNAAAVDAMPAKIGGNHTTDGTNGSLSGNILNPGAGVLSGIETDAIGTGPAIAHGIGGFDGQITGKNTTAGDGTLNGTKLLRPLPVDVAVERLEIPLGSPVRTFLVKAPQEWVDPGTVMTPLQLHSTEAMLGATEVPSHSGVVGGARPKTQAVPGISGLPLSGLPLSVSSVGLPEVGQSNGLLTLGKLLLGAVTGNGSVLPQVPGVAGVSPGQVGLPVLGGQGTKKSPATELPKLPVLGGVPSVAGV